MNILGKYKPYVANGITEFAEDTEKVKIGGNILSFYGRLSNFDALRRRLLRLGCSFTSKSAAELILRGYNAVGADIFETLEGDGAGVLYVGEKNRLYLFSLACKTLYLMGGEGELAFSSLPLKDGFGKTEILPPYRLYSLSPNGFFRRPLKILGRTHTDESSIDEYFSRLKAAGFEKRNVVLPPKNVTSEKAEHCYAYIFPTAAADGKREELVLSLAGYRALALEITAELSQNGVDCEFPLLSLPVATYAYAKRLSFSALKKKLDTAELYVRFLQDK